MTRANLPQRRRNETREIEFGEHAYSVCVGFYDDGTPAEVFAHGAKEGSDMRHTLADACVLISIALQHGVSRAELEHSLGRVPCWVNGEEGDRPASIIGAVIAAIEPTGAMP